MKHISFYFAMLVMALVSCNSGGGQKEATPQSFCADTSCISEPMKFDAKAAGNPFVTISFKDCMIDSIHWEKGGAGNIKDIIFSEFINNPVKPSKEFLTCEIINGKNAWVRFNDCTTGRGYVLKLPFDPEGSTGKYTSALNNFDPKFIIGDGLVAYYDNTFIYVQDMNTEKVAKQLLTETGVSEADFNDVHSLFDSVNITKSNIYAKLKVKDKEVVHNAPLTFK